MKLFLVLSLIFAPFFALNVLGSGCNDCQPLAEVSITNAGLEKIIEASLNANLRQLSKTVSDRAGFRKLVVDQSQCGTQTVNQVLAKRKAGQVIDCIGLPELNDDTAGATLLRPYKLELGDLRLNALGFQKARVQCASLHCDFQIVANQLDLSGNLKVDYTDKNENFVPSTRLRLQTTPYAHLALSGQVILDPQTGQLNDLVFLDSDHSNIHLLPGSLKLDMTLPKGFPSREKEIELLSQGYRQNIKNSSLTQASIEKQYAAYREHAVFKYSALSPTTKSIKQRDKEAAEKFDQDIIQKFGSIENLKQKLKNIQWPDPNDDRAVHQFLINTPPEIQFLPEVSDQLMTSKIAAVAANAGFSNTKAFQLMATGVALTNAAGSDSLINDTMLEPLLKKEIMPLVQVQANDELRKLKQYWNQLSKVPVLDFQNLVDANLIRNKLKTAKTDQEKATLTEQLRIVSEKNSKNWIPIDTQVLIDQNSHGGQLLRAQISKTNPACDSKPKRFSDSTETDFDLRTDLGLNTVQEYFDQMAKNNKLDVCLDSKEPFTCKGGTQVKLNSPPKITCENGQFQFEVDAETRKSLFGPLTASADLELKIKASIQNCDGQVCFQLSDGKGRARNMLIGFFANGLLERGITSALNKSSNFPVSLPNVQLKNQKTSPQNCQTQLDWTVNP